MFDEFNYTKNKVKKQTVLEIKMYGKNQIFGEPQLGRTVYVSAECIEWMAKEVIQSKCSYDCNNWRKMHGLPMKRKMSERN